MCCIRTCCKRKGDRKYEHDCFTRKSLLQTQIFGNNMVFMCFTGVGIYITVFVRNKAFPRCGKTFFVNNSCEFDEHACKKTFPLNNVLLTPKNVNG